MNSVTNQNESNIEIIKRAFFFYFEPIEKLLTFVDSFSLDSNTNRSILDQNLLADNLRLTSSCKLMQKSVCFNQGQFIQYSFILAERHKELKDAYRKKQRNHDEVARRMKNLLDFANSNFYESAYENFKILHTYFESTKRTAPRICIKGNFNTGGKKTVVTVFRDTFVDYDSDSEVESNYGFNSIYNSGKFYLENNVPLATVKDKYKNPRLSSKTAKKFYAKNENDLITKWDRCWDSKSVKDSHYKSTLIIPMTLRNNKLSEEFKKLIKLENVDRTIFGFLCFDHSETNYFDEDTDVSVGYAIADILSLYVLTRIIYIDISESFKATDGWLDKNSHHPDLATLSSLLKDVASNSLSDDYFNLEILESGVNELFSIDQDLFDFAKSVTKRSKNR